MSCYIIVLTYTCHIIIVNYVGIYLPCQYPIRRLWIKLALCNYPLQLFVCQSLAFQVTILKVKQVFVSI